VLVVVGAGDAVSAKSLRNVPAVRVLASGQLNTHDVLACDHIVFTQAALAEFVARTAGADLVTVDKPAATPKRARTAKPTGGGTPGGEAASAADERAAGAAASAGGGAGSAADEPAAGADASAGGEAGGTPDEAPSRSAGATASRARKPATAGTEEPAASGDEAGAPAGVMHETGRTPDEPASSASGAEQDEEQE
jgi:large subunit ribosomal protein L4